MHIRLLVCVLLPFCLCAQPMAVLNEWKNDVSLSGASYGFCVRDVSTGKILAEHNPASLLIPASTLKLLTTSAALDLLGNNFHFQTHLLYTGTFNKQTGVLQGDLIIRGSGDPSLESENFAGVKISVTDLWAKALKDKGLREIKGRIIADASCFSRAVPDQWIWGDIGNYYGAVPCGLSYRDNKFKVLFQSKESGSKAQVLGTQPNYVLRPYSIVSEVIGKGSEDEAYVYGDPFGWEKKISGTIPPNQAKYEVEAALPDPALLCAEDFLKSLVKAGIVCTKVSAQSSYQKNDSLKGTWWYTHNSPSLDKIIFYTNTKSINLYCESLVLTMGKGDYKAGLAAIKKYLVSKGLNADAFYMSDGSGLSRSNTCTANLLSELLVMVAKDSAIASTMKHSLPQAGKSGSMSNIGKGSAIEQNMVAKTGYITRARAYSGYVKTKSGKELAFSVMLNNYTCSAREAKLKLEKWLISLAEL